VPVRQLRIGRSHLNVRRARRIAACWNALQDLTTEAIEALTSEDVMTAVASKRGAGGYLTTSPNGRYIDGGGDAHQRALLSCAAAMGVTDFTGFGDVTAPRTPLPAIGA